MTFEYHPDRAFVCEGSRYLLHSSTPVRCERAIPETKENGRKKDLSSLRLIVQRALLG
jgi:hypothetical protein